MSTIDVTVQVVDGGTGGFGPIIYFLAFCLQNDAE